jgi:hypothetical protein
MVKSVSAIITGLIAGLAAIFLGIMIISTLKPFPTDLDINNSVSMENFIDTFSEKIYIVKILTNIIGAFVAGLLSSLVADKIKMISGLITIALLFSFIIFRDARYDYSNLYVVINLVVVFLAGLAGVFIGVRRTTRH